MPDERRASITISAAGSRTEVSATLLRTRDGAYVIPDYGNWAGLDRLIREQDAAGKRASRRSTHAED